MSFNMRVSINEKAFDRHMKHAEKQVEFATSLAIGMTAGNGKVSQAVGSGGAREDLKTGLKRFMTVRGKKSTGGWMGKGIRATRANKRKPYADVGTIDPDLRDQALGAVRRNPRGESIPSVGKGMPRTSIDKRTPESKWAGNAITADLAKATGRRRLFSIKGKNGNTLIMRKTGPTVKRKRYGPGGNDKNGKRRGNTPRVIRTTMRGKGGDAKVMWAIAKDITVKPNWPFVRLVQLSVIRHWARNADAAFDFAFRTAR